jgi:DNA-binding CsgD family transcriptional regulator/tetratricopeptide (TPR) repeat protein
MTGHAATSHSRVRIRAPRFVGRDREMAALNRALTAAPAVILVEGEAGIGKSRLITECLAAGTGDRLRVLRAACLPFRQPHTLGPLVDAIRDLTEGVAGLRLSPLAGALRPLFPEWAGELPAAPEPAEDATAARHRLFRALAELIERLRVASLIVEDVHWADEATLEFLLFLTSRRQRAASLVLTRRPEDTSAGSLLPLLTSRPERITLEPLGIGGTAELIASMLDDAEVSAEFAGFVHHATEGVPLAVEELVRLMGDRADLIRSDGEWLRTELDEIEVPPTIRDAVLERARRLGGPAKAVLRAAAVLAVPTTVRTLAAVTELATERAQAGMTEALASGMLAEDRGGRLEFRHALTGRAVYDAIPMSERGVLHLRAATILKATGAAEPATLARHFREAGEVGAWAMHAEQAADAALASGDESSATRLLHELISGAELDAATLVRLMRKLPFGCLRSGTDFDSLLRTLRAAARRQDLAVPVRGEVRYQLGRVLLCMDQFGAAHAELESAIADLEQCAPVQAAEAMAAEAMAVSRLPPGEGPPTATLYERLRRVESASAGLASLDRLRITAVRIQVLLAMGQAEGWTVAGAIPEDGSTAAELPHITLAQLNLAEFAMRWGRYAEARRHLRLGTELAERREYRRYLEFARVIGARLDYFTGNWPGLRRRVAMLSQQVAGLPPVDQLEVLLLTGLLNAAHGEAGQAEADLRRVMAEATRLGTADYAAEAAARLGRLFLAGGRVQDALAVTGEPMRHVLGRENWTWAVDLIQVRAEALAAADLVAEASECARLFARWTRRCDAPAADAAVASCRAIVASARREPAASAASFARAAALWQALPRPYDALLARERQAEYLIGAGRPDDGTRLLREVLDGLHELGASDDERRVTGALRRHGVATRRPGAGRPSYGARLSPRERDVARLVAEGLTNAEIAGRLFLSPSTVAQHVNSARRKVNAASRTALAVRVAEGGLD